MTVLSKAALTQLAEYREQPCASLYLPTHRESTRVQEDRTRFKNLLGRAESLLRADGFGNAETRRVLVPAFQLLEDRLFWQHQQDGLALFLSPTHSARIQLPLATDPLSAVGRRFYLKPLFRLMKGRENRSDGRNGHGQLGSHFRTLLLLSAEQSPRRRDGVDVASHPWALRSPRPRAQGGGVSAVEGCV